MPARFALLAVLATIRHAAAQVQTPLHKAQEEHRKIAIVMRDEWCKITERQVSNNAPCLMHKWLQDDERRTGERTKHAGVQKFLDIVDRRVHPEKTREQVAEMHDWYCNLEEATKSRVAPRNASFAMAG